MLHLPRWQVFVIILALVAGFLAVVPNFFSRETVAGWPDFIPKRQMVLGLDLQGGAYLLYEVDRTDYVNKRLRALLSDARTAMLQAPRINYTGLTVTGTAVQLRITDTARLNDVRTRLEPLRNPLNASLLSGGSVYEFDLNVANDGLVRMVYSEAGLAQRVRSIVEQSIEVIDRRINELGTTESSIQRQGEDRILVEAPGLGDPERLKALVGQTAQLTFHMVQSQMATTQASGPPAVGSVRFADAYNPGVTYVVDEVPLMTGEDLVDAQTAFDQQLGIPVVNFKLTVGGARKFGDVTTKNVGKLFAIVLDDEVISAPVIREPILGGSGQISGSFTVETANDLAILLRAGSLPAKLTIVEERTVGPSLGADSIRAGIAAVIVATITIAIFMILCYGLLGVFAVVALIANNVLMIGILTALGATLTLPGMAGIVLTMAMAVDANVLIYERMREEQRAGRGVIASLDTGFRKALATIVDAHLTALIAAIALFEVGTGPVRGFAVTLAIGIVSTLFTAYLITRLIISAWVRAARPKVVPL
jgi:preprotein translocase subunit SecD/SecD/SecF fusion protein